MYIYSHSEEPHQRTELVVGFECITFYIPTCSLRLKYLYVSLGNKKKIKIPQNGNVFYTSSPREVYVVVDRLFFIRTLYSSFCHRHC